MGDVFKALDDQTRRLILDELAAEDGRTLFDICNLLTMRHGVGSTRQAISQHLAVLEDAGLVSTERKGRTKVHYFDPTPLAAITRRWPTSPGGGTAMKIKLATVFVNDLLAAVDFYTNVLGFTKKHDIPLGGGARWITVVSPDEPDGAELLLEPAGHPAVHPYREALVTDGIPLAQFTVDDVATEYERLSGLGVQFTQKPTDIGDYWVAVFDDTCGNLIQLVSAK